MKKLLATCDRILARLPVALSEGNMVGGIIIPAPVLKAMDRRGMAELEIVSAGPDCKVARTGDRVVVNKAVCEPLEWDGQEYMVFSEVTAFAVIRQLADVATPSASTSPQVTPAPLTMDEIKSGLGIPSKPVDDASDLPVEPAANAQPAQAAP